MSKMSVVVARALQYKWLQKATAVLRGARMFAVPECTVSHPALRAPCTSAFSLI